MGSLKIIVESILCPFSFLKPPNLFCPFPPSLFLVWKTHSFIGEPRYRRWEQQETRPSPLLVVREHRPTQRKGESEGVWEWKRQGNLRGGMSVENPWSCQLMLVHPSPHPHTPDPAVTSPSLALSLRWEAAAFFRYFLTQDFTEHKLHHRLTGEI